MSERRGTGRTEQAGRRAPARGEARPNSAKSPEESPAKRDTPAQPQERNLRRAVFLAELAEAKELRKRVAPRKTRAAELHARLLRTFRY